MTRDVQLAGVFVGRQVEALLERELLVAVELLQVLNLYLHELDFKGVSTGLKFLILISLHQLILEVLVHFQQTVHILLELQVLLHYFLDVRVGTLVVFLKRHVRALGRARRMAKVHLDGD